MHKNAQIKCANSKIVDVDSLIPNPKNPNKHPEKQIKLLAKIIKHQGQRLPIVVSKRSGFIVSGHGRLEAIKSLGWRECAIDEQEFTTEADEYAHMIADNKIAEIAEHDDAMMIQDLRDMDFKLDFDLLGMEGFELPTDPVDPQCDEDEIPEHAKTRCKRGDIWQLGNHRLMCGDSTMIDDVEKLMSGEKADITFTSPPYNVGATPNGNENKYLNYQDNKSLDSYKILLHDFTTNCLSYSDFVFSNIQSLSGNKIALIEYLYDLKDKYADTIIWDKETAEPAMARKVLNSQYEYIHIFSNEANRAIGKRDFRGTISNIFRLNSRAGKEYSKIHKATFRVELPQYFVENFTESSCLDPFGGTGTTLIACEKTGRKCFMMEIDEHYCDVIVARWEKYTGKTARKLNG